MATKGYKTEELRFPSSDGTHTVYARVYLPTDTSAIRGIVQLAHGMCEHIGRYEEMGVFFAKNGYVFCGNDHLGHGNTAISPEELGFFMKEDGVDTVVSDLFKLTRIMHGRFLDKPLFLMGHSMGSFLVRIYATTYARYLSGLLVLGTGGPNPLLPVGRALAKTIAAFRGKKHRSQLLRGLAHAGYLSRCGKNPAPTAWLSTDENRIAAFGKDEKCGFTFTVGAYLDLFEMLGRANDKTAYTSIPKTLPVCILSGDKDPVGAYGKGVKTVARQYEKAGITDLTLKLYEGMRHELHNEICRDEFYADLLSWLNERS